MNGDPLLSCELGPGEAAVAAVGEGSDRPRLVVTERRLLLDGPGPSHRHRLCNPAVAEVVFRRTVLGRMKLVSVDLRYGDQVLLLDLPALTREQERALRRVLPDTTFTAVPHTLATWLLGPATARAAAELVDPPSRATPLPADARLAKPSSDAA